MQGDVQLSKKVHLSDTNIINSSTISGFAVNFQWGYQEIYWTRWKETPLDACTEV